MVRFRRLKHVFVGLHEMDFTTSVQCSRMLVSKSVSIQYELIEVQTTPGCLCKKSNNRNLMLVFVSKLPSVFSHATRTI